MSEGINFPVGVWVDPETEDYCARIFIEANGLDLAAWGIADAKPIDLRASGIHELGRLIESELENIAPNFPMSKFNPLFLGPLPTGADVRGAMYAKLAEVAA